MRIYDIALMLVRALVAMDLVRAGLELIYTAIRYSFLIGSAPGEWATRVELSTWMTPIYEFVAAIVLFALAKPIARFAAKLASPADAAVHF